MAGNLDDTLNLRAEWLQYRTRLFDRGTGLPTLPAVVDDLRRHLEDNGAIALLAFMLTPDRQVEERWGWQAYDAMIRDFVQAVHERLAEGPLHNARICLPAVRSDELLTFIPVENGLLASGSPGEWLSRLASDLEQFVREFLGKRLQSLDRYEAHVGQAVIVFDPKVRVERVVYRGVREARGELYRRTAAAEQRGIRALKEILARREIVSLFQPIFRLLDRQVTAVEALSRGPVGSGFEDAEALFSLAERTDLIGPLERLCRRRSLEEAARAQWPHLIFVNMSPAAASDVELLEGSLRRDAEELHLDPKRIVIEMTERTYAERPAFFAQVLSRLRQDGFRVAVDDMGSGYSNLSSLAEIKPEFLKFDHLFTKDIHRHRIKQDLLAAILGVAVGMDTQVIAEGIETPDEFEALRRLGVPMGQGYFLARPGPLPAQEATGAAA